MTSSSGEFPTTQWSLIEAMRRGDEGVRRSALEILCRAYWMPLYAFARGSQLDSQGAKDAVQDFFVKVLRNELWLQADAEEGKLRNLLCIALKRHIGHLKREEKAIKRGGGVEHVPWLPGDAEERYRMLASTYAISPDEIFQREWARSLIIRAQESLRRSYELKDKARLFRCLAESLPWSGGNEDKVDAAGVAGSGLSPEEFRLALHRMRKRLRLCIRAVVKETLQTQDSAVVDAEIADLLALLAP
jgi:DNA-directed RNA polymerase specialized sigma24 family protein